MVFPINTGKTHLFQFLGDGFDFDAYMGHGQSAMHSAGASALWDEMKTSALVTTKYRSTEKDEEQEYIHVEFHYNHRSGSDGGLDLPYEVSSDGYWCVDDDLCPLENHLLAVLDFCEQHKTDKWQYTVIASVIDGDGDRVFVVQRTPREPEAMKVKED